MAKLSLWLLTLAKDKPFEFLDHAIRCGDSLVGIHDLDQLKNFNLDPSKGRGLFTGPVFNLVDEAVGLRRKIETMPSNSVEDVEAQEKLLAEAEEKTARLRCAADLLLSVELQGANAADKQSLHDSMAIQAGHYVENGTIEEFREVVHKALKGQQAFHWPLEFPEVFQGRGGFDAFVCNPPFMGGLKLETAFGTKWREYVVCRIGHDVRGVRGTADLCAYFFLRAASLMRCPGHIGFIATNTIAQGDTRTVGLDRLLQAGTRIIRAVPSCKWPGRANLQIATVWLRSGSWKRSSCLDGAEVEEITAELASREEVGGEAYRLHSNLDLAFQGSNVMGLGFVIDPSEAAQLLTLRPSNREVVFPYLIGQDVNSRPDQSPSRWIINFSDWELEKASQYPECLEIVRQRVKPERDAMIGRNPTSTRRGNQWWLYAQQAKALYQTVSKLTRVLVTSRVSAHLFLAFTPTGIVYSDRLVVFALSDYGAFALLSSSIHSLWATRPGSTTHETRGTYFPSSTFETFPFPSRLKACEASGAAYETHRKGCTHERKCGLTDVYNCLHAPDDTSTDIQKLRQLHVEMDQAVAAAYGWTDLNLGHDFHQTKQGLRYTISEATRREALGRLLRLNHERYAEEVTKGLHEKKKPKTTKTSARKAPSVSEPRLFGGEE
jgi:hypothetical protein